MRRVNRRRITAAIVTFGVGGLLFALIGTIEQSWWMVALGAALLGVMVWGIVQLRREPPDEPTQEPR